MSELRFPLAVEIVPGAFSAMVHSHKLSTLQGEIPCWSYVSKGLKAVEHPELVITLRREVDEPEDAFPDDPLQLFMALHQIAGQGKRVGPGEVSELGGKRFFGHHLVYARAQPLGDVVLPPGCLAALPVNDEELRAVREFGATRVLARMGEAARYFPFPPWTERGRAGLAFERAFDASLLVKVHRYHSSIQVVMSDNRVTARAMRSQQPRLREIVAAQHGDGPFAMLTTLDGAADSCLVWHPGQRDACAIAAPGSKGARTCGCFLGLLPGQPEDGALVIEDGFVLQLTTASWEKLLRALGDGTDLAIPATGMGMSFALEWMDERYVSPIDGEAYNAEGGWHVYHPLDDAASEPRRARAPDDGIRLLTAEATIAARCSKSDFTFFCGEVLRCMERTLARSDGPAKLLVRMTCTPAGHRVELAPQGLATRVVLQQLHDALGALATLPVREGDVVFEVGLTAVPSS
jgi:hypothetical protein